MNTSYMGTASTASESEETSLQKQVTLINVFPMLILMLFAMTVMIEMEMEIEMLVNVGSRVETW